VIDRGWMVWCRFWVVWGWVIWSWFWVVWGWLWKRVVWSWLWWVVWGRFWMVWSWSWFWVVWFVVWYTFILYIGSVSIFMVSMIGNNLGTTIRKKNSVFSRNCTIFILNLILAKVGT